LLQKDASRGTGAGDALGLGHHLITSSQMTGARSQIVDLVLLLIFLLPEGKVLLEEFDDALGVTEVVFLELVDLVEGLLEGLVGKLAGSLVVLHDFVVEDREVEGKAKLDGVAWGEGDLVGLLVGTESVLLDGFKEISLGVLGNVTVVVSDHLDEEGLGLFLALLAEDLGVDHVDDALAVGDELGLDAGLVGGEGVGVLGVLGVLLDGGNGAAGGALGRDEVLESDGEEVAFVGGDVGTLVVEDEGEEIDHVFEAFGLLGDAGEENVFFN
jgi:hypothetical protein